MGGICYVGDIHGRVERFEAVDRWAHSNEAVAIVQVGDFGIFWSKPSDAMSSYFEQRKSKGKFACPVFFVDGNHENHDHLDKLWEDAGKPDRVEVAPSCFHVRRGSLADIDGLVHLFCGGARSTDRGPGQEFHGGKRIWWPQEVPSRADLEKFAANLGGKIPDVVVTHEAPSRVPLYRENRDTDPTARALDIALETCGHEPKYWFFGHHHTLERWVFKGTEFLCAGLHGEAWLLSNDSFTRRSLGGK